MTFRQPGPRRGTWPRSWPAPPALAGRLALLVAAVAVPLLLLSFWTAWQTRAAAKEQAEQALVQRARTVAALLDSEFERGEALLRTLAGSSALARGDVRAFESEMRAAAASPGGDPINLVAVGGDIRASTRWEPGEHAGGVPASPAALASLATGRTAISNLIENPLTGKPSVKLAVPVHRSGAASGRGQAQGQGAPDWALVLDLSTERFVSELRNLGLPEAPGWVTAVLDREGQYVARSALSEEFLGRGTREVVRQRLVRGTEGLVGVLPGRGQATRAVYAFARAPHSGYAALVSVPQASFEAPARRAAALALGLGLLLLLLGLLLSAFLSRGIVAAFRRAARVVEHPPDTLPPEPTGLREADEMAQALSAAVARRTAAESGMRGSEARLRSVVETAADGILVADEGGRIVSANPAALRMFGYDREDPLVGRELGVLMPAAEADRHPGYIAGHRASVPARAIGVPGRELLGQRRDGTQFPIELSVSSFVAEGRHYFTGVVRDATQRRAAEAAVREKEAMLNAVIDALPVGLLIVDAQGRTLRSNAAHRALWGIAAEGEGGAEHSGDERKASGQGECGRLARGGEAIARALATGQTTHGELGECERAGTGERRDCLNSAAPILDAQGRVAGGVLVELDVTETRRTETALRASEERLRLAAASADLATWDMDYASGTAVWSPNHFAMFGLAPTPDGRIAQATWRDRIHPDDLPSVQAAVLQAGAGQQPFHMAYRVRLPGGEEHFLETIGRVIEVGPGGEPRRAVGITLDVTERHRLEARLRQGQKMQALGELAGGVAHDFNNVLQTVRYAAELLARRAPDDEQVCERTRRILDATERGAAITRRLLSFARRSELHAAAVDPVQLLHSLREMLAGTLGRQVAIELDAPAGLPALWADRTELEVALINLATNARDAMPGGGTLTLSARHERVGRGTAGAQAGPAGATAGELAEGGYIRLAVRDTGSGMEPAMLARVVEPFFTTKPAGQGTGLGLSMAKGFAEQSGGAFAIHSVPGEGTTVQLWLPDVFTAPRALNGAAPAGSAGSAGPGDDRAGAAGDAPHAGVTAG